ncbi:collagen alpha-6(VI) chain-like isoform X5 [Micropterus dolomieu]|nr:collagen alpha-6(VI) chain-like isoform X5 [Micropterus dolomieu]XP_045899719.1 collagen alpha-6(VI) chain-like isoform X5 [Micropterus dolomieu]XP_045899720.1 collagen alpha-6(VI) chain-like isoform X5 [Micropterus dolomieu]XP_045899721.1 collagen alpha-6(VI) chain-like isoform X5 [Micropterus dolomieu]XP_045899722.1 collagen alpha-6(VI) chain-like isoform X5 [Micropterus dolomieu]
MKGGTSLLFCLIIAACSCGIAAQTAECENATVADIVFLVDGSSSIDPSSFQEVRIFLRNIIRALDVGPNKVRIGVAQYSDDPYQEFLLKDHKDKKSLLAAVDNIPHRTGGTETGKGIDFLLTRYFTKEAGSRASQRVPQIAVVITDGESADDVKAPAQRLRQNGVIVFGIGVGKANREELESIANRPSHLFLFAIDSYQAIQRLTDSLLRTVCVSVAAERQALSEKFADIFFLVDSGIAQGPFTQFRSDLIKLINQLNPGASTNRIGLAQYGEDIKIDFGLSTYKTKQEIVTGVRRFRLRSQPNQPRNLGNALTSAKTFFTREAGGRAHQGFQQFLVVVSGKDSDDPVSKAADVIESEGIIIAGVDAGATMDVIEGFESISHVLSSSGDLLKEDIFFTEKVENVTEDCKGANVADIVFIVDESGSIGTENFRLVRSFLHSIVSGLTVGPARVRVGIVTYSDKPTAHVYLKTFNDKRDILRFIKILPYSGGGTNTGAALNFTREEVFIAKRGSRVDVQQVAIVITDGRSQDSVSEAAIALRRAGVTIYAIGIENADEAELLEMASHPPHQHIFNENSFTKLNPLKQRLQKTLCSNIIHQAVTVGTSRTDVKEACEQLDEADIFFLMDDSGSIGNEDFKDMINFIIDFVGSFRIGPQHVRIGLVKYADFPTLEFDLTTYSDAEKMKEAVKGIPHKGGGTETGRALSSMGQYFESAKAARPKVPKYLIVITDGNSTDPVKTPADKLREQGIRIYAIGVKAAYEPQLVEIAGDQQKTFKVGSFDALGKLKVTIIREICSPEACKDASGDVIFLTDSSDSIYPNEFKTMKEFMISVVNKSAVALDKVHFGVMQFSNDIQLEFPLDLYYTKEEMFKAIRDMQQLSEGTYIGKGLREVSQYFDASRGGRPNLKQWLVVITDGRSKDEVKGPAEALRAKQVVIYSIGVGKIDNTQLTDISGSSDRTYVKRDFDGLKDIETEVALKICDRECKKTEKADIIFLVDGSTSIDKTEFDSMRKFMESIVKLTTVGKNLTRFGVIMYATTAESAFTLNNYESKQKVLEAITSLKQPKGDTYTGEALAYSRNFFNAEHGGRKAEKVPQILMVITDGDATDHPRLKDESDALRENKVTVFSIGVKEAVREQLDIMAGGDTSKVFYVDNFKALETLYKNMSSAICNSTKKVCEQADLVFLIDRSSSINKENHQIVLNFTAEVVNSFNVSKDFVHVGLAQFSDEPHKEFDLNTYYKKEEMMKTISNLKYTGGNTLIGKALVHIKDYFKGGRFGVPQNLVVITDGDSQDDVEDAAEELRAQGVVVFAIALGDVHDLQLLQMTGDPERLFNVRSFDALASIKRKVVDALCKSEPEDQPSECTIDIAMGFDITTRTGAIGEMLFSGHAKLQSFLPEIVRYVSSVEGLCCVKGPVRTQIAFQVSDREGRPLYDTNFEGYSEEVVKKITTLLMLNPSYFNTAVLKSFKEKFRTGSTARVKVLVMFSDGLDEDVIRVKQESELLRQSGVSALLTVALEGARNPGQLPEVEFGRGYVYLLPLSIGMPSVSNTILKQILQKIRRLQ